MSTVNKVKCAKECEAYKGRKKIGGRTGVFGVVSEYKISKSGMAKRLGVHGLLLTD